MRRGGIGHWFFAVRIGVPTWSQVPIPSNSFISASCMNYERTWRVNEGWNGLVARWLTKENYTNNNNWNQGNMPPIRFRGSPSITKFADLTIINSSISPSSCKGRESGFSASNTRIRGWRCGTRCRGKIFVSCDCSAEVLPRLDAAELCFCYADVRI